jgi:hypothetical protein
MNDETPFSPGGSGGRGSLLTQIARFPWTLLLVVYLAVCYFMRIDLGGEGIGNLLGYVFIGLGLVVLFVQFFKSADISTVAFIGHLVGTIVSVIVASVLMTLLLTRSETRPTFHYWYACAIILADAILSPFNSFRTAKRNFAVGDG